MLVEAAIVFIGFVLMTVGIMDMAKFLWTFSTLSRAVTIAARCAAVSQGLVDANFPKLCPDYQQFAADSAMPLNINFTVSQVANCGSPASGSDIQVGAMKVTATITYQFRVFPYAVGPHSETACFTLQQ